MFLKLIHLFDVKQNTWINVSNFLISIYLIEIHYLGKNCIFGVFLHIFKVKHKVQDYCYRSFWPNVTLLQERTGTPTLAAAEICSPLLRLLMRRLWVSPKREHCCHPFSFLVFRVSWLHETNSTWPYSPWRPPGTKWRQTAEALSLQIRVQRMKSWLKRVLSEI